MDPVPRTGDFHPQDWIIVVEALAQWAGNPKLLHAARRRRAYDLIDVIADEQGLPAAELLKQVDSPWPRRV